MLSEKYQWILKLNLDNVLIIWKGLGEINTKLEKVLLKSGIAYSDLAEEKAREEKLEEQLLRIVEEERELREEEIGELQEEAKLVAWVRNIIKKVKIIEEQVNYFVHSFKLHLEGRGSRNDVMLDSGKMSHLDNLPEVEAEIDVIRKKIESLREKHGILKEKRSHVSKELGAKARDSNKDDWFVRVFRVVESDLVEVEMHLGVLKKLFRL